MFFLFESMAGKTMLTALHFHTEQTGCGVSESNLMLMAGLKNIFRYNRLIVIILTSILWVLIRKFKDNHHCLFLLNIGEIKLVGHPIFSLLKRVTSRGSLKYSVIPKFLPSLLSIVIVHLYLRVNQFTVGVRFIHSQSNFGTIQLFIGKSIISCKSNNRRFISFVYQSQSSSSNHPLFRSTITSSMSSSHTAQSQYLDLDSRLTITSSFFSSHTVKLSCTMFQVTIFRVAIFMFSVHIIYHITLSTGITRKVLMAIVTMLDNLIMNRPDQKTACRITISPYLPRQFSHIAHRVFGHPHKNT